MKVPEACIAKNNSRHAAWCGRALDADLFSFLDAEYAIRHYELGRTVRACPKCVVDAKASGIGAAMESAPVATRGIK